MDPDSSQRKPHAIVPDLIGRYRVDAKLGEGGMGIVYRAYDAKLQRTVAIKMLSGVSDFAARKRLLQEARAASALNHPHVCTIHEVDETGQLAFIVMEYVEGKPLSDLIPPAGVAPNTVVRYGLQISDALAHAHDRGIVHGDVKAANVLMTPEGRPKVVDFGLAKRVNSPQMLEATTHSQALLPEPGLLRGTLPYMAPEQLRGEPTDARSDVWSLGVLLYEMTTGVRPFHGQTGFEMSSAILSQEPSPLPEEAGESLRAVIGRCLEKEPQRRYQRAGEARAALEAIQTGAKLPEAEHHRMFRHRRLATAFVALAAVAGFTAALDLGGLRTRLLGTPTSGPIRSIVVLPLENLSGDSEQEYFADGMTEALTSDLAKLGALRVISRTSAMNYKNSSKSLPVIARELNVDAVVEGSVLRVGQRVRSVAQLIHASTDAHLWTDTYDGDVKDLLRLQSDVAQAIAREIKVAVTPEEQTRLTTKRTVKPETYEAYLRGTFFLNKLTPEGIEKGLAYLRAAIENDPADALAYAGLAQGYSLIASHSPAPPPDASARAKAAALRAVELDETLAEAHSVLAQIHLYTDWDWAGAEREFQRALALNPTLSEAHAHYAWYLNLFGRQEEAQSEMRRAVAVDPLAPLWTAWIGDLHWAVGEYDRAIEQFKSALELDPNFPWAFYMLGTVYAETGLYKEATEAHQKAVAANPDWKWALARTYVLAGRRNEAEQLIAEYEKEAKADPLGLAAVYTSLGDREKAFQWLQGAYKARHPFMPWIKFVSYLKPLRSDPRLEDLARRAGLP